MEAASIAPEDESEMPKRASANPEQPSADPADKAAADRDPLQRFLETGRELGCEENFDRFEEALASIIHQGKWRGRSRTATDVGSRGAGGAITRAGRLRGTGSVGARRPAPQGGLAARAARNVRLSR